jgi:hypothetical protein
MASPTTGASNDRELYFFFFLVVPAGLALIACRCFCCPLQRKVTGSPVWSRRHAHPVRYTVTADPWGDCFESLNTHSGNSLSNSSSHRGGSRPSTYTNKDLRCDVCGELSRRFYSCEPCGYDECADCFTALGGGADANAEAPRASGPSAPPARSANAPRRAGAAGALTAW